MKHFYNKNINPSFTLDSFTPIILLKKGKEDILKDKILLDKEVSTVKWEDPDDSSVVIECSDGSKHKFDHVIFTASLGVLKKHHGTLFTPKLPMSKAKAIMTIPMGLLNKFIVIFPERWWPENSKGFSFLWREQDRENILKEFPIGPSLVSLFKYNSGKYLHF